MSGLVSDPVRQANDAIRGYIYQIVRSVSVWLDIGDDETLYLEGAEDLDRIAGDQALAEQVKDTVGSGSVTLRTASAVQAIDHFWSHVARNPDSRVRFRYLTTSESGIEQGAPFGSGQGGIALWNTVRAAPASTAALSFAGSLRSFLLNDGRVGKPVRDFLELASPADVISTLIEPFEWLTGQQDGSALVRTIKDRLISHGAVSGIAPADAELAFHALYCAAFDAAAAKDRTPLTRAHFLRIFAGATAVQIPKNDILALLKAALAAENSGVPAVQSSGMIFERAPPLPARYFRRLAQEQQFKMLLNDGAVSIHGSTGSGKTLAVASGLIGMDPIWLPLRDLSAADVRARLSLARQLLRQKGVARTLVVDDLDALADPRPIEACIAGLWLCQKELGGQLVLTSDRPLPARLAQAVELTDTRELQLPPFDRMEIDAFLRQSACPDERVEAWAGVLEVSTLGHPQLVSVRISTLVETGFPQPRAQDILKTPPDIDRIRFETRRLIAALPNDARELLYRASLMTGRLTRSQLITIAGVAEPIDEPGTAIDVIAGPWLEPTDDEAFRVSPLARGVAEEARGKDWIKAMHGHLSWTYLQRQTLTPSDISSLVVHCFINGATGPLVHILQILMASSDEIWSAVAETCDIYAGIGLADADRLPFERHADLFTFRIFQYRIAAETNPETAMRIAARLEREFAAAPNDDGTLFFRFLYLSQFLSQLNVRYPLTVIVARAQEFFKVAGAMEASLPERMARTGRTLDADIPTGAYAQYAALRLISHVEDIEDLEAMLHALATIDDRDARALLESIGDTAELSWGLIEKTWLSEQGKMRDAWPAYCQKLTEAFDYAARIGATTFACAIAPVLLRVLNEDVGDPQAALAIAAKLREVVGDAPLFLCALAKVMSDAGDFVGALVMWRSGLPRLPATDDGLGAALAHRSAAIASGRNGHWSAAAQFFDSAHNLVANGERVTFSLGLAMDAAFCRFNNGDRAAAVNDFDLVVAALEPLQAGSSKEPLLSLQRRISGVIAAIAEGPEVERKDLAGICSDLDPFQTSSTVPPPLDAVRTPLIMLQLAHATSLDRAVAQAALLRTTSIVALRTVSAPTLFRLALRTRDFSEVVGDGLRQLDAQAMLAEQVANNDREVMRSVDGKHRPWSAGADELLVGNIILAAFELAAANELDRLPIDRWRTEAASHPNAVRISTLIAHLDGLFVTAQLGGWATVMRSSSRDWALHAASALAAPMTEPLGPEPLLLCHALWVHYLAQPYFHEPVAAAVERMVTTQWRGMLDNPALFVAPRRSIPRLQAALDDPASGWTKVRLILQAALDGVPLPRDDQARVVIEAMKD